MKKITKSAICVAVSVSLVTSVVIWASGKKELAATDTETTTVSEIVTTITEAATAAAATTTEAPTTTEATAASASTTQSTTKATTTAAPKKEVLTRSNILENAVCVQRWSTSGNGMSAKVEKIRLNLNVYENGQKTSKTVQRDMYLALIKGAPSSFKAVSAKQATGKAVDTITNIARGTNALFAVNGEMCNHSTETFNGFFNAANDQPTATVIKNGIIPQVGEASPSLAMNKNGVWEYPVWVTPDNAQDLISQGVVNTVSYTYPILWNGQPYMHDGVYPPMMGERDTKPSNPEKHYYNAHTLVGQIDANTYVVAVSEGFGRGFLCDAMIELGVQNAYWGNGGHCSAIYVKGAGVVNRPGDTKLCKTADIMCF